MRKKGKTNPPEEKTTQHQDQILLQPFLLLTAPFSFQVIVFPFFLIRINPPSFWCKRKSAKAFYP